ncbi:hypothetical protein OPV22_027429 [Ensete ventricosum]|uniref:Uncharacterized protein n=1 Tax=Ensete ventricosum TaxID=4639 RepID=A0AAV8P5B5_ENSVE|nr:hypothetical protein OPV22_027429 [Ensete ventricosum]
MLTRRSRSSWSRDGDQPDLPGDDDAEACSAAASYGPEEFLAHGFPVQNPAIDVDYLGVHNVVSCEAILPPQEPEAAATKVAISEKADKIERHERRESRR